MVQQDKSRVLVFKRPEPSDRIVLAERKLKHPLLAVLFGWICEWIMEEEPIDETSHVLTFHKVTHGVKNQVAGEASLNQWKDYVDVYGMWRAMQRNIALNIEANEQEFGKVIGHHPLTGTIYNKSEEKIKEYLKDEKAEHYS